MKITAIRATPVNIPLETPFHWSVGTYPGTSRMIVEVETNEVLVGLGEARHRAVCRRSSTCSPPSWRKGSTHIEACERISTARRQSRPQHGRPIARAGLRRDRDSTVDLRGKLEPAAVHAAGRPGAPDNPIQRVLRLSREAGRRWRSDASGSSGILRRMSRQKSWTAPPASKASFRLTRQLRPW